MARLVRTVHTSIDVSLVIRVHLVSLTTLRPKIILHQNKILFNNLLPLIHGDCCTSTIGICIIIATNPYPLNFRVMQPIMSSCAREDMRKVISVAPGRDIVVREAL